MAMTKTYYTVNGRIIGEKSGGVRTDYLVDALGSVVGTVNQSAQVVNTYRYKPYGAQLAKTGTGADPAFAWVGTHEYRPTNKNWAETYVYMRHYGVQIAAWTTGEEDGALCQRYAYVLDNPTSLFDSYGQVPVKEAQRSLKPGEESCKYYRDLCNKGYIFACNSWYACMGMGDSPSANCVRACLQERMKDHFRRRNPSCRGWVEDHVKCFKRCNFTTAWWCTNDLSFRVICNQLIRPNPTCVDLFKRICGWPNPPSKGIEPPKGKPWIGLPLEPGGDECIYKPVDICLPLPPPFDQLKDCIQCTHSTAPGLLPRVRGTIGRLRRIFL